MEDDKILREAYTNWVKSPSGIDLLMYLEQEANAELERAIEELDGTKALGLLQKVNAYRTIKLYIERMSVLDNL